MSSLLADLRFGWRLLFKQPAFTLVMILTLALGIGVTTAIASIVYAILINPWPYEDPEELIALRGSFETKDTTWVSYLEFQAWQERSRAFEEIAAHRQVFSSLEVDGRPKGEMGVQVSANLFEMLGVTPHLGRTFTEEEDRPGAAGVVVLSFPYWHRQFGGREDILGEVVRIEEEPFEVIGVMGPGVLYPGDFRRTAFWLPLEHYVDEEWGWNYQTHGGLSVTGRLQDGGDLAAARADMSRIAAELAAEHSDILEGRGVSLVPVLERSFGDLRPRVLALFAAVLLVLLIACVNVANLLLVRGARRSHEFAVRSALGASRGRVFRQLLIESVLLSLAGAVAGLVVARVTLEALLAVADIGSMPAFREVALDGRILLFTGVVALVTGLVFGLAPALEGVRGGDGEALRGGAKSSASRRGGRIFDALVVAEVALALMISICAVLSVRSFYHIVSDDPGFDPSNLLTFVFSLTEDGYAEPAEQAAFFDQMLERLAALPGVEKATTTVPIVAYWSTTFEVVGRTSEKQRLSTDVFQVSPGFFDTMGVEVVRGRGFLARDRADAPQVVVIDQAFAETFWPGREAVGERIRLAGDPPESLGREVVGVVVKAHYDGVHRGSGPTLFEPMPQSQKGYGWVVLRTLVEPTTLIAEVSREMADLDPTTVLDEFWTMDHRLGIHRGPERLAAALLAGFAALALVLAALGVYAMLAFSVAARGREIGVRMALGATPGDIVRIVLRRGLLATMVGVVLGWVLAAASVRLLASQLYNTDPYDPVTWLGLTLTLLLGAYNACAVPAWRAGRVQPTTVLYGE